MLRKDVQGDAWALAWGKRQIERLRDLDDDPLDEQFISRSYQLNGRRIRIRITGEYEYLWARRIGQETSHDLVLISDIRFDGGAYLFFSREQSLAWPELDNYFVMLRHAVGWSGNPLQPPPSPLRVRLEVEHPGYAEMLVLDTGENLSHPDLYLDVEFNGDGNYWQIFVMYPEFAPGLGTVRLYVDGSAIHAPTYLDPYEGPGYE